jgi:hypothetical protein
LAKGKGRSAVMSHTRQGGAGDCDVKRHDRGEVQPAAQIVRRYPRGEADLSILQQDRHAKVQMFVIKSSDDFAVIFDSNRKNSNFIRAVWSEADAPLKLSRLLSKLTQ